MSNWKQNKTQYGSLKTASSGGTLTLTASSKQFQIFTGTLAHTLQLPDATTTSNGLGILFTVINESTGAITVNDASTALVATVAANSSADFLLTNVASAAGTWRVSTFSGASGGGIASSAPGSIISSNYSVLTGDKGRVINVDCSSAAITIMLPAPAANFVVTVKDAKGYANVNNITVKRNGSEKIDTIAVDDVINIAFSSETYISDGTDWFKIAEFTGNIPGGRAIFGGTSSSSNLLEYLTIASTGTSSNFGSLSPARTGGQAGTPSSSSTGIWGGSNGIGASIDYVLFNTLSSSISFGSLTVARESLAGCSSSTRGLFAGGTTGSFSGVIDYVTIASIGNATSFGTLTASRRYLTACASATRAVFAGGGDSATNVIDYVTIASTGNAISFGVLTSNREFLSGCSNAIRGVFGGGFVGSSLNLIDYVTIATTANSASFGTLTIPRTTPASAASVTRGLWAGGGNNTRETTIDYVTLATLANAVSWGNLLNATNDFAGCSNCHGGL